MTSATPSRCSSSIGHGTTTGPSRRARSSPASRTRTARCARCDEETGLVCGLGEELPATSYRDAAGRPKRVRYWRMEAIGGDLEFRHEIDDARWLSVEQAAATLTYERDLGLLEALS